MNVTTSATTPYAQLSHADRMARAIERVASHPRYFERAHDSISGARYEQGTTWATPETLRSRVPGDVTAALGQIDRYLSPGGGAIDLLLAEGRAISAAAHSLAGAAGTTTAAEHGAGAVALLSAAQAHVPNAQKEDYVRMARTLLGAMIGRAL